VRGDQAHQYEAVEADLLPQVLAFQVQAALGEYRHENPDFQVGIAHKSSLATVVYFLIA
jgi:hypothetical protein